MYCKNCAVEIDDKAVICPKCGVAQTQIQQPSVVDNGGFGWGLLGFFFPIVGLVLVFAWNDTKPKSAKSAGIGALVSTILGIVLGVAVFGIGTSLLGGLMSELL